MTGTESFFITLALLGLSAVFVKRIKFLSNFNIPPSLVLSIPVLVFATMSETFQKSNLYLFWKEIPGLFIALVFTGLFLQKSEQKQKSKFSEIAGQTSLIMIIALGQMTIGIILTYFLFTPFFHVPSSFAQVLETGFTGGHGTAVAMGPIYAQFNLPAGLDFGLFSATVGLLFGTIAGIWLIKREKGKINTYTEPEIEQGVITVFSLMITAALIATAFLLGTALQKGFEKIIADSIYVSPALKKMQIPLFVFCMAAAFMTRKVVLRFAPSLIENHTLNILGDYFLELLIFAGIATINLKIISDSLAPLLILFSAGIIWNMFCHFKLRPKFINQELRFQLGLINFGMTSGTTATGLMLLKIASPRNNPAAVKVFAESAVFTQPFVGGGLLTLAMPLLVTTFHPLLVASTYITFITILFVVGVLSQRRAI